MHSKKDGVRWGWGELLRREVFTASCNEKTLPNSLETLIIS